nr:G-type lectin S-receptor-like serine/threonine-protein kinase At4g27290 [Ipomoea batatas]
MQKTSENRKMKSVEGLRHYFFCSILLSLLTFCTSADIITTDQPITEGRTIVSAGGNFELGFFSPGRSKKRYIGIWYSNIPTKDVVWVANRETPLNNTSGKLMLKDNGILVLLDGSNEEMWSSNSSTSLKNPVARLLDTGNLVVREGNGHSSNNSAWQSFDYPGNTFLPGMKLGRNLATGHAWTLTSWKSADDPALGEHTRMMDNNGFPQIFQLTGANKSPIFRPGTWNGEMFTGVPSIKDNPYYTFEFIMNEREIYYTYELKDSSVPSRVVITPTGMVDRLIWIGRTKSWIVYLTSPIDNCDHYGICGAYGKCNINSSPPCDCLKGFIPKYPKDWDATDWSNGCVRRTQLDCGDADSCTAYSNVDVRDGGSGCLLWFGDLTDIRTFDQVHQDLYVRIAASDSGAKICKEDSDLPLFTLETVVSATNNFSSDNFIGKGGFGPVYKGKLPTGTEIAVKKLSEYSGQGAQEWENEVIIIAKLQHRNLVTLQESPSCDVGVEDNVNDNASVFREVNEKTSVFVELDEIGNVILEVNEPKSRKKTSENRKMKSVEGLRHYFFCSILLSLLTFCTSADTITTDQPITDGRTIVSAGGLFELGFFSPGGSKKRYIGIWYSNIPTKDVVWVANRETPLNNTSGKLMLKDNGILVILDGSKEEIWSSNSSTSLKNPVARLLDTGNLVVREGNGHSSNNYAWQSFDYPGNTLLPGMKLDRNIATGHAWSLTSWKSDDDPALGKYTHMMDINGFPEIIQFTGANKSPIFRPGAWNGVMCTGAPNIIKNPYYRYEYITNDIEVYYTYELGDSSVPSRVVITPTGMVDRLIWIGRTKNWIVYLTSPIDNCDRYGMCGAFGKCNINNSPPCDCLKGFIPKYPQEWDATDWSNGCVRRTQLDCGDADRFYIYRGVKMPDTRHSWYDKSIGLEECKKLCLKNCSCTAYSNVDVRDGGSGCLLWFGDLTDIRTFDQVDQDLYMRIAASDSGAKIRKEDYDLPLFTLETVVSATNNFSSDNFIGKGGFGPVYKGKLPTGTEIAVKKLSEYSGQGAQEWENEVIIIAKLQHRNLVTLQVQIDESQLNKSMVEMTAMVVSLLAKIDEGGDSLSATREVVAYPSSSNKSMTGKQLPRS